MKILTFLNVFASSSGFLKVLKIFTFLILKFKMKVLVSYNWNFKTTLLKLNAYFIFKNILNAYLKKFKCRENYKIF